MGGKPDFGKLTSYFDPTTKAGRQHGFYLGPYGGLAAAYGYGIEKLKKGPKPTDPTAPPPPPDITDKAIQAARRREDFRTGSRRNSFITGPMGDNTSIPVLGKSVITGG